MKLTRPVLALHVFLSVLEIEDVVMTEVQGCVVLL
jgi:hypothetical protein